MIYPAPVPTRRARRARPRGVRRHPSPPSEKARCTLVTLILRMFLSVKIGSNHAIQVGAGFFGIYANATRHHPARGGHARQLPRTGQSIVSRFRNPSRGSHRAIAAAGVSDLNFCTILQRMIGQTAPPLSIYGTRPRAKVRRRAMGAMRPAIENPHLGLIAVFIPLA